MRPDQLKMLEELSEKLVDVILLEADPQGWPGAGMAPADMTQEERGDRYWCKKNAAATLTVLTKTMSLAHFKDNAGGGADRRDEDEVEKEIATAEAKAAKILKKYWEQQGTAH